MENLNSYFQPGSGVLDKELKEETIPCIRVLAEELEIYTGKDYQEKIKETLLFIEHMLRMPFRDDPGSSEVIRKLMKALPSLKTYSSYFILWPNGYVMELDGQRNPWNRENPIVVMHFSESSAIKAIKEGLKDHQDQCGTCFYFLEDMED